MTLTTEQTIGVILQSVFWAIVVFTPSKEKNKLGSEIGLLIMSALLGAIIMHAIMVSI